MNERARRRERVFRDRTNPLEIYNDTEMFKKYRFDRAGVVNIIDTLPDQLEHPTNRNKALSPSQQVFVALQFFATGSVLDDSSTIHVVSRATTSRTISRVSNDLCGLKK